MRYIVTVVLLLATGCSSVSSLFDDTHLLWQIGIDIESVRTPDGFTITPKEIHDVIPLTKYKWNIYADKQNYYISSGIQKVVSKTGDNSALAKKTGYKIGGCDRVLYMKLVEAKNPYGNIIPAKLRAIIDEHNK